MKKEYFIVISAIIFGILVWILDSGIDSIFFYEDSFPNLVLFKIPKPELVFRAEILISFTVFGVIISFLFHKQRKAKDSLIKIQNELEKRIEKRTAKLSEANKKLTDEISYRIHAENSLRHNQKMLEAIFNGILDPLILLDEKMRIKILNKSASNYYDISEDLAIYGSKCHQVLNDSYAPCKGCEISKIISSGQNTQFERKGFMDPERLEVVNIYPVKNEDADMWDILIRISDITDQRLLEKRIINQEKMATLGVFISSIAHEINNPIGFISFNIPILKKYIKELMTIFDAHFTKKADFAM